MIDPKNIAFLQTGRIFDQIIVIGLMSFDKNEWSSYIVPEIKKIITEYEDTIELVKIGFPKDWEKILLTL